MRKLRLLDLVMLYDVMEMDIDIVYFINGNRYDTSIRSLEYFILCHEITMWSIYEGVLRVWLGDYHV